jgi:hypothetical protein
MLRRAALVRADTASIISVIRIGSVLPLLVTDNVVPISPILVALMMEAIRSYKTSFLIRAARRNISEDGILHSHRREKLKPHD